MGKMLCLSELTSNKHFILVIFYTILFQNTLSSSCLSNKLPGVCNQFPEYSIPVPNNINYTKPSSFPSIFDASVLLSCPGFLSDKKPINSLFSQEELGIFESLFPIFSCHKTINSQSGRECNSQLPIIPPLCPSTCLQYWSVFFKHISNSTLCPDQNSSFDSYKNILNQCASPTIHFQSSNFSEKSNKLVNSDVEKCVDQKASLATNCGFESDSQLKEFCTNNYHTPCCLKSISSSSLKSEENFIASFRNPWFISGVVLSVLSIFLLAFGIITLYRAKRTMSKIKQLSSSNSLEPTSAQVQAQTSALTLTRTPGENTLKNQSFGYQDSMLTSFSSTSPQNSVIINTMTDAQFLTGNLTMKSRDTTFDDSLATAYFPYQPVLPDELTLDVGDQVAIQHCFDDGWALGRHLTSGAIGALPMACLQFIPESTSVIPSAVNSIRVNNFITRRSSSQRISRFLPKH